MLYKEIQTVLLLLNSQEPQLRGIVSLVEPSHEQKVCLNQVRKVTESSRLILEYRQAYSTASIKHLISLTL